MALRLVLLLAMVCLSIAQTTDAPTDPPTTAATTTVVDPPTPPPVPVDPPGTIQEQVDANYTLAERYNFRQAYDFRNSHFFCPEQGIPFVQDEFGVDTDRIIHNWSLFLQYPILAYLDTMKKGVLINQIVAIINQGGFPDVTTENLCIGRVEHFDVSLYTESVLINFYLVDTELGMNDTRIIDMDDAFRQGTATINDPMLLQDFREQQAIVISNSTYGEINSNVHPGAFDSEGRRFNQEDDPTLRAVILGYWPRQFSLEDFVSDRNLNATITSRFALNPNPVFYGLTPGDYVFIVVATLLCCLLAFLMVFGFCIQPFFM